MCCRMRCWAHRVAPNLASDRQGRLKRFRIRKSPLSRQLGGCRVLLRSAHSARIWGIGRAGCGCLYASSCCPTARLPVCLTCLLQLLLPLLLGGRRLLARQQHGARMRQLQGVRVNVHSILAVVMLTPTMQVSVRTLQRTVVGHSVLWMSRVSPGWQLPPFPGPAAAASPSHGTATGCEWEQKMAKFYSRAQKMDQLNKALWAWRHAGSNKGAHLMRWLAGNSCGRLVPVMGGFTVAILSWKRTTGSSACCGSAKARDVPPLACACLKKASALDTLPALPSGAPSFPRPVR